LYFRRALTSIVSLLVASEHLASARALPLGFLLSLHRTFASLPRAHPSPLPSSCPRTYVLRYPSLPPLLSPLVPSLPLFSCVSLFLPLESTSVSSSRDFTWFRVRYGRLQTSRMQAIKCVVVGDGYVKHRIVVKNCFVLGTRIRRESYDPQRNRRDRRDRRTDPQGTIVGERLPWDALLAALRGPITSITFPDRERGALYEPTTPVRARETTLTCSRVFSRGRHVFFARSTTLRPMLDIRTYGTRT